MLISYYSTWQRTMSIYKSYLRVFSFLIVSKTPILSYKLLFPILQTIQMTNWADNKVVYKYVLQLTKACIYVFIFHWPSMVIIWNHMVIIGHHMFITADHMFQKSLMHKWWHSLYKHNSEWEMASLGCNELILHHISPSIHPDWEWLINI